MRPLNDNLLRDLAEHKAPLCLSLFMDVARGGGNHNHIRISLKNTKSEANDALDACEGPKDAVEAIRQRLDALDYDDVVGGHDRRIAVYIAPDRTEIIDARFVETGVHLGEAFRLAPLLGDLDQRPDHAILAASQEETCLYQSSGGVLTRQDVPDMPNSLHDISKFTDQQEKGNIEGFEDSGVPGSLRGEAAMATGRGGPQGVPHYSVGGHDWREDKEGEMRHYANLVINAAQHHLSGTNVPLIIAADERLYGMLRDNSEYPFLLENGITLHPREMDEEKLREEANACLEQEVARRRDEVWEEIAMSLGREDGEASKDPLDIVTAAASGRIAHLFVRPEATMRGSVDPDSYKATASEDGPEDLVDRAIIETLRQGGDVFPLSSEANPDTMMAASYRYPT
ncbi:baeRF3 domain-containing protein [Paracoccus jeotgali]|uniref:Uncharacterized protein n=1 Tax=Paracoccus jeotgali TaxID=2065379 RepID=A0A2K9MIN4_9RHOB|nr:hypothetical protein [Paracoccus jeotgali]AUM74896.1 hypothetical protein CYR75_11955 [Paracoccus jeotgali]